MKKLRPLLLFFGIIFISNCTPLYLTRGSEGQNIEQSYRFQKYNVEQSAKAIAGYKAGLTSKAGQAKFKVKEPVAGVLFQEGLSHQRQVYLLSDYEKLMLETEIGFILKKDIPNFRYFPKDPNFLHDILEAVIPVIELPNLAYPDMSKVTGLKLIETNVASNQFLIGKGVAFDEVNLNEISTILTKNGDTVIQGKSTDAMGDQIKALEWLIMTLQSHNYQLEKGDILITGALGKMIPAERGQYDADFGPLGKLSFSIR